MKSLEQLELLWRLQDLDLAIAGLQEKIESNPLLENVRLAKEKQGELQSTLDRGKEWQAEQRKKLKMMELDLNKLAADRAGLHNKLYGGEVSNIRELELMEKRLVFLGREQEALEEKIIRLMEEVERRQVELEEFKGQVKRQEQAVLGEEDKLERELANLGLQLEQLQENRDGLLPLIESKYMDLYRTQCQRHGGRYFPGNK